MDTAISARGLAPFIFEMQRKAAEEKLYSVWLHKSYGESYEAFRRRAIETSRNANMTPRQQKRIIDESFAILDNFDPEGVSG